MTDKPSPNLSLIIGAALFVTLSVVWVIGQREHFDVSPLLQWGGAVVAALLVGGQVSNSLARKLSPVRDQLAVITRQTNGDLSRLISDEIKRAMTSTEVRDLIRNEVGAVLTHRDAAAVHARAATRRTAKAVKE